MNPIMIYEIQERAAGVIVLLAKLLQIWLWLAVLSDASNCWLVVVVVRYIGSKLAAIEIGSIKIHMV